MRYLKIVCKNSFFAFLDDILVYSKSWDEHFQHLEVTMATLRSHKLFAKKKKSQFGQNEVQYLGHVISNTGVAVDPLR